MSDFIRAKLSYKSLDTFVKKHTVPVPDRTTMAYTTEDNKVIYFSPGEVLCNYTDQIDEFKYLLGQTVPFHSNNTYYPLKYLAWIKKEDGSSELWTSDSKLMTQFLEIANKLCLLTLVKGSDGPLAVRDPNVKPVIHKDT